MQGNSGGITVTGGSSTGILVTGGSGITATGTTSNSSGIMITGGGSGNGIYSTGGVISGTMCKYCDNYCLFKDMEDPNKDTNIHIVINLIKKECGKQKPWFLFLPTPLWPSHAEKVFDHIQAFLVCAVTNRYVIEHTEQARIASAFHDLSEVATCPVEDTLLHINAECPLVAAMAKKRLEIGE